MIGNDPLSIRIIISQNVQKYIHSKLYHSNAFKIQYYSFQIQLLTNKIQASWKYEESIIVTVIIIINEIQFILQFDFDNFSWRFSLIFHSFHSLLIIFLIKQSENRYHRYLIFLWIHKKNMKKINLICKSVNLKFDWLNLKFKKLFWSSNLERKSCNQGRWVRGEEELNSQV